MVRVRLAVASALASLVLLAPGARLVLAAMLASPFTGSARQPAADTIIHNAVTYTVEKTQPIAEAVAVAGDRIVFVGSSADALKLRSAATRVIDAHGATVIPGLQDAHGHFAGLGAVLQELELRGTRSYDEIVALVGARVAKARPGEWIRGRNWDQNDWPTREWPTHDKLDAVAPNNPVYLTRVDGHAGLANTLALEAAGITRATEDPQGGRLIRDGQGNPIGVFIDRAQGLVTSQIPPYTPRQVEEHLILADQACTRLGLTMVHDAGVSPSMVETYKRVIDEGKLKIRIYAMLRSSLDELEPFFARGPVTNYANHHLMVRAIKIGADGALGSRGAALLEPYSDEPANRGLLTTPPEEVYAQTLAASKAGFQTCIHAIGDRANREVLDVFERVQKDVPNARALRMRDEHAQILDAADIPRFGRLGVVASMQATHCTSDMPWAPARLGPERVAEGAYVWQKLMTAGTIIANGSDFPVEEPNPMLGIYAAITRQDQSGQPPGGWAPDQRMSRAETLASFTIKAAYAGHLEHELGSLAAGKLADLVMLSKDIMKVPPKEILETSVRLTMIGGRIVHQERTLVSGPPARGPRYR
ncbi:MAG: amidohydrolase [Acidobacteria bacterium]|nr:amidohydrolase [Acidobacteriota bacterium]